MPLSVLKNGKHWNARPTTLNGKQATEFHVGWVNYLDSVGDWCSIDCEIVEVLGSNHKFEVTKAPFNFTAPEYADGEVYFASDNCFDVFNKSLITAPEFGGHIRPVDTAHVMGQIFDINGDGRMDAILYPNAYPQWDADLIYYVKHGKAPELQKLIRLHSEPSNDINAKFVCRPTAKAEVTPTILSDLTKPRIEQLWDATIEPLLNHNQGFYSRAWNEPQKRGVGFKNFKIWDSSINDFGQPKTQIINADFTVQDYSQYEFILTKHIPASFFSGVTFPVYTDATSTFYPSPGTGGPTVDGYIGGEHVSSWSTVRGLATGNSGISDSAASLVGFNQGEWTGAKYIIRRQYFLFDTSSISTDNIDSSIFSVYSNATGDDTEATYPADIAIVSSNPASNTSLIFADFDQIGSTKLSDTVQDLGTYNSSAAYFDFALNAVGISNINKTGISKFGIRPNNDFSDSTIPTARSYGSIFFADETGTTKDPKLVVVHSLAGRLSRYHSLNGLGGFGQQTFNPMG